MLTIPFGIVIVFRPEQYLNAAVPMLVTLFGIVTIARLALLANALTPIATTGMSLVIAGISAVVPEPVQLLTVNVPLFVVNVN